MTFSLTTSHPRSLLSIAGRKIPKYQYVGFGFSYRHDPVLYRLNDPTVIDLVGALHRVGERTLAEVREVVGSYFQQRDAMEPVSRKDLAQRLRDGSVTVLDVRPADKFVAGHLPRAINIPLRELRRRLRELPKERDVVAYCRGPYCVLAFEAAALLRKHGFSVRRLEGGFPEWKAAGLPTA